MSLTFHFLLCSFVSHTFGPLLNPISHSPLSPHPTNKMFCTLHCVHRVYGVMTVHAKLDIEQAGVGLVHARLANDPVAITLINVTLFLLLV